MKASLVRSLEIQRNLSLQSRFQQEAKRQAKLVQQGQVRVRTYGQFAV